MRLLTKLVRDAQGHQDREGNVGQDKKEGGRLSEQVRQR
jgi:hypothetical protein